VGDAGRGQLEVLAEALSLLRQRRFACLALQELADLSADDVDRLQAAVVGLARARAGEEHADGRSRSSPGKRKRRPPRPGPDENADELSARESLLVSATRAAASRHTQPERPSPRR